MQRLHSDAEKKSAAAKVEPVSDDQMQYWIETDFIHSPNLEFCRRLTSYPNFARICSQAELLDRILFTEREDPVTFLLRVHYRFNLARDAGVEFVKLLPDTATHLRAQLKALDEKIVKQESAPAKINHLNVVKHLVASLKLYTTQQDPAVAKEDKQVLLDKILDTPLLSQHVLPLLLQPRPGFDKSQEDTLFADLEKRFLRASHHNYEHDTQLILKILPHNRMVNFLNRLMQKALQEGVNCKGIVAASADAAITARISPQMIDLFAIVNSPFCFHNKLFALNLARLFGQDFKVRNAAGETLLQCYIRTKISRSIPLNGGPMFEESLPLFKFLLDQIPGGLEIKDRSNLDCFDWFALHEMRGCSDGRLDEERVFLFERNRSAMRAAIQRAQIEMAAKRAHAASQERAQAHARAEEEKRQEARGRENPPPTESPSFFKPTRDLHDLHKQYRDLARKYHPDKGGNPETFKQLGNAYAALLKKAEDQQQDRMEDTAAGPAAARERPNTRSYR